MFFIEETQTFRAQTFIQSFKRGERKITNLKPISKIKIQATGLHLSRSILNPEEPGGLVIPSDARWNTQS